MIHILQFIEKHLDVLKNKMEIQKNEPDNPFPLLLFIERDYLETIRDQCDYLLLESKKYAQESS